MWSDYPGCRTLIRQDLLNRNIPEESVDICLASITRSTLNQYNSGLRLWWDFCVRDKIEIFAISPEYLIKFLTFHFNRGMSFGTLNSYRSAINQISAIDLSEDSRVKRFFKGVYGLRPNLPKYESTWDPSIVLNHFGRSNNEDLSLQEITLNLAMLLLLASG